MQTKNTSNTKKLGLFGLVTVATLGATALANAETYTVQKGDTLSAIAKKNGTTVDEIVSKNGIQDANKISVGQNLTINETTEETTEEVASGSWQQTDGNWWYQNADGTYPTSCWQEIDGQWYVFDENGYIRTGWYQEGDKWYYFQENGAMAHDTDVDGYHLGSDGVKPFIDVCKQEKKGLFILVKTSNPSSGEFQDQLINGKPLYEMVGEKVAQWGEDHMGDSYSYIGAVVGATYPEQGEILRKVMPKSFILVPGYGAQGGKGKDLVHFFNEDGLGAIVNSSRGIIAAYKQEKYAQFGAENFADASRQAVIDMIEDIASALK